MPDSVRVARLLRRLIDDVGRLDAEATAPADRRSDAMWLRGVKYTFVTAIESVVDIAQHLCARGGWGPPEDNGDAIALLADHGVLDGDLAISLRRASGFRNVLVHGYIDVDDDVVIARLEDLSDLRDFAEQIEAHLRG